MALTNTGGLLQPLLAYRFRVLFDHEINAQHLINNGRCLLLTQQVVDTNLDLLHNKFTVKLRQPVTPELFSHVINMTENPNFTQTIVIEPTNGKTTEALWSLHLTNCKCISHECNFDYTSNELVYHNMTFKFMNAKITEPVDWEHIMERGNIPPREGAISPEEAVEKIEKDSEV